MEAEDEAAALLPDDVWLEVFGFLHPEEIGVVALTCRRFAALFQTPALWRHYHDAHVGGPLQFTVPPPSSSFWRNGDGLGSDSDEDDDEDDDTPNLSDSESHQHREEPLAEFLSAMPRFPADGWRQAMKFKLGKVARQRGNEARLVWAARLGCDKLVERILREKLSHPVPPRLPEDEDSEEARVLGMLCRALSAASWANSLTTAKILLDAGAAPLQQGYLGVKREALVEAIGHRNLELMDVLIAHGALSERWNYVQLLPGQAILEACWCGSVEAVKLLLKHGIMWLACENEFIATWGVTDSLAKVSPLCVAAARGHIDIVSLLLSQTSKQPNEGEKMSALLAAIRAGNNRMIEHLRSYDIRVNDEMILIYMEAPSFEVDTFMRLLTGVSAEDAREQALCWSIFSSAKLIGTPNGKRICELLQSKGADINIGYPIDQSQTSFLTPLGVAGHLKMAEVLLDCGADPNVQVANGLDLIELAQKQNHTR